MGVHPDGALDLTFLDAERPQFRQCGCLFFESARAAIAETDSVRRTLDQLDLNYFLACRCHDRTVGILGLGKTMDGDYLTSEDLELLLTIGNYVGIAIENARLYNSLEQKATQIERLKDFNENIVESLNIGVLTVDLEDCIESWNPQLVRLLEISRSEAVGRRLNEALPADLVAELSIPLERRPRNRHLQIPSEHSSRPPRRNKCLDCPAGRQDRNPHRPSNPIWTTSRNA